MRGKKSTLLTTLTIIVTIISLVSCFGVLGISNSVQGISIQKQDLDVYALDMKGRGQTLDRINGVTNSLLELSDSMALSTNVNTNLPSQMTLKMKNRGRKL